METKFQRPRGREGDISALNAAIQSLKLAENISNIIPAKTVFAFVITLLTIDKGMFPALLQQPTPGLHLARTQWLMNWIVSSSDYFVPISAKRSTGG
jgi:hypothetical protein